jgi:hypothetical protein
MLLLNRGTACLRTFSLRLSGTVALICWSLIVRAFQVPQHEMYARKIERLMHAIM